MRQRKRFHGRKFLGRNLYYQWHEWTSNDSPKPGTFVLAWDGMKVSIEWFGSCLRPSETAYTHWAPFDDPPGADLMYGMYALQQIRPRKHYD